MHQHTDIPWKTVRMMNLENPDTEGWDDVVYQYFINEVAMKVCELDDELPKSFELNKKMSQNPSWK